MHLFRHTLTLLTTSVTASFLRPATTFQRPIMTITPLTSTTDSVTNPPKAKARSALDEHGNDGSFVRKDAVYRNWVKADSSAKFPAEKDRYHLYVSYACPWAHRTLMVRALKGLTDVITVTVVHPIWQRTRPNSKEDQHAGWFFGKESDETWTNSAGNGGPFDSHLPTTSPDPFFQANSIRDIYEAVNDQDGKYTVPILLDKKTKTIVSNESSEIIRMFNTEFNAFAQNPELDLYPEDMREAINKVNEWVYPGLNNGVYRCGFAKSQKAYDQAITELTETFDKVDNILLNQRYIVGDRFTEADIRLFVTLVRFDEVYAVYFKTNTRSIAHTPAILNYCREIYQMPGVAETVNMEHIKMHYYCSHPTLNFYSIIPKGADFEKLLKEPHDRESIEARPGKRARTNSF